LEVFGPVRSTLASAAERYIKNLAMSSGCIWLHKDNKLYLSDLATERVDSFFPTGVNLLVYELHIHLKNSTPSVYVQLQENLTQRTENVNFTLSDAFVEFNHALLLVHITMLQVFHGVVVAVFRDCGCCWWSPGQSYQFLWWLLALL
jgi:hypothetical protein